MKLKNYNSLSDETLNALADNEFPASERADLLAHLEDNEESRRRLCEISHLKDRVKTAYSDIPQAASSIKPNTSKQSFNRMIASVLFALLVIGLGFVGFNNTLNSESQNPTAQRMVMLDPDGRGQKLSQNNSEELRVIFHVSNTTHLNADELLDDIESLLKDSIENNKKIRIEVVAHASGLDLLRDRLSTEKRRITAMSKQYPELTFVACLNTVERIEREKGIDVKLISEAVATLSGVAHVVMRLQQGWIYIQV